MCGNLWKDDLGNPYHMIPTTSKAAHIYSTLPKHSSTFICDVQHISPDIHNVEGYSGFFCHFLNNKLSRISLPISYHSLLSK